MIIEAFKFGNIKLAKIIFGNKPYVTCTSITNHWMRSRRLERIALAQAMEANRITIHSVDTVTLDKFRLILIFLIDRYDRMAKKIAVGYLTACWDLPDYLKDI